MFLPYIFDPKIIYQKCELNRSCNVPPKSWRVGDFVISCCSNYFLELHIRQRSSLWQAIYGASDVVIYTSISYP